jgi:hypothetical protein
MYVWFWRGNGHASLQVAAQWCKMYIHRISIFLHTGDLGVNNESKLYVYSHEWKDSICTFWLTVSICFFSPFRYIPMLTVLIFPCILSNPLCVFEMWKFLWFTLRIFQQLRNLKKNVHFFVFAKKASDECCSKRMPLFCSTYDQCSFFFLYEPKSLFVCGQILRSCVVNLLGMAKKSESI